MINCENNPWMNQSFDLKVVKVGANTQVAVGSSSSKVKIELEEYVCVCMDWDCVNKWFC